MFDLSSISRSRRIEAPRILVAGLEKVGKSSFAAGAPDPIFIQTESGLSHLDVNAFPLAQSLGDIYEAIGTLLNEDHSYKTVVCDSLDWAEILLQQHVAKANGWKDLESPGFGKGYVAATQEWKTLIDGFEALRRERGMAVVFICHVEQKKIESPTSESFDSYVLKIHRRAAALVQEFVDHIGFCAHRIALKKTDAGFGQKETKAIKTGERVLHLEPHPAYPSGSRFGLRDCPLSWDAFATQLQQANNPELKAA